MSDQGQDKGKLQKAREEVARRGSRIADMDRAHHRLENLFEISKLLTRFRDMQGAVTEVIALVAQTLPLRSAIVTVQTTGLPQTIVWQAEGESTEQLQSAKAHVQATYGYLVRSRVELERGDARTLELPPRSAQERSTEPEATKNFIVLPLVVAHGSIFGALQLEGAAPFDERDLVFANAVVNQLAVAVDRLAVTNAKQAATEASEMEQRLLARLGAVIVSSLDRRTTFEAVARCAVPLFADVCIIDEVVEHGAVQRLEVLFADESKQRNLAERMKDFSPRPGWRTPHANVLESGKPFLLPETTDPLADGVAHDEEHARVLRAAGIRSMMVLPLVARGRTLGAIAFYGAESGRRYSTRDLATAEEIARLTALATDNAWLYEQAQRATRARQDLLSIVSHDLKNPLGAILLASGVLLRVQGEERRKSFRRHMELIERNAQRMNRLIKDLLDTASIEAGHLSVAPDRLDIARLVSDALEAAQPAAESKSISLRSELPTDLPAISADDARLQQVFANLLGNAIKFTQEGGTVTISARPSGDTVTFSVTDTGPGIAPEDLPHLFDRFWQATHTATLGTGLGLFIVKGIVETHGGKIWVESTLGEGCTFFFALPSVPTVTVTDQD